jgi:hypothetical protein
MSPFDVLVESINIHIWRAPADERDPETLQFATDLIEDLATAGYVITKAEDQA